MIDQEAPITGVITEEPIPIKPNGHAKCPQGVHSGDCACTLTKEAVSASADDVKAKQAARQADPEYQEQKARRAALQAEINGNDNGWQEGGFVTIICKNCGKPEQWAAEEVKDLCVPCYRKQFNDKAALEKIEAATQKARIAGEVELASGLMEGKRVKRVALNILEAHTIATEELAWLWEGRILGAKITLFAGLGDCGKSTVLVDLIARITTGRDFPDGVKNTLGPRRVLMAFTEDDAADTEVPKLIVAGADLTKVMIISKVSMVDDEGKSSRRPFNLKDDLLLLARALKENPDIALVALDPIAGFWGGRDSNKDDDMRPAMEALKEVCGKLRVAIVGIIHLNKKSELKSVQRVSGAGAIGNVTRCVWMFSQDPEDKNEYYMSKGKGNLIPREVKGLKYTTVGVPITFSNGKPGTMFKVDWLGEHDMNADEVDRKDKAVQKDGGTSPLSQQMQPWIKSVLEQGPKLATEMYDLGKEKWGEECGKTLKRAEVAIGGLCTKTKPYYWYLPGFDGQFHVRWADGEPIEITKEDDQVSDTEML
jgi:hypothetical protein